MPFTEAQTQALAAKLSAKHVRTRQSDGRTLSYIEGWHAIAEANRIFGFDAWDRQTVAINCVWQGSWRGRYACSYVARVRVRVRAGDADICREGCGSGHGKGATPGEAHESALKEAETDAMKRALATFGNPFGLALYDKAQSGVRVAGSRKSRVANDQAISWVVLSAEGEVLSSHHDPVDYCAALRQVLEAGDTVERLKCVWSRNAVAIEMLRTNLPDLKTEDDAHYADILTSLYRRCLGERQKSARFEQPVGSMAANMAPAVPTQTKRQVDKAALKIGAPSRVRDKEHLAFVAARNCLVCGRYPSQAHHVRFAQPRALGRKVSDEFVVPLCATHHRALHNSGKEEDWWRQQKLDPIKEARRLWEVSQGLRTGGLAPNDAVVPEASLG